MRFACLAAGLLFLAMGQCRGVAHAADVDPRLAKMVYGEFPRLDPRHADHAGLSDWDKVRMLRDFSYRHTAYSNNVKSKAYEAGNECVTALGQGKKSLAEVFEFFDAARGGVVCGGTTQVSIALLRAFGFDAYYLGSGFQPRTQRGSNFSHAETLIRIRADSEGESILTLHDASANLAYTEPDGKTPLDYYEFLRRLAAGQDDRIGMSIGWDDGVKRSNPSTICFADETDGKTAADFLGSWNIDERDMRVVDHGHGRWQFISPRAIEDFETLGDRWWKPELEREGRPPKTIYLHLYPFMCGGEREGAAILEEAQRIVKTAADKSQ